jgi:membrane protease subunit HflK
MRKWIIGTFVLLLVGYLLTGVTQVRTGERAVVRRFGKVVDVPAPGLYIGLPWGMDRVDRVPADLVRRVQVGYPREWDDDGRSTPPGQLLTGDHNLVNLQVEIHYAAAQGSDPEPVVQYLLHADRGDSLVARVAESVMAEWVARRSVDDVLLLGKAKLPEELTRLTQERITSYGLGVQIRSASVIHLLPPDAVKAAFDDVSRAQTNKETALTRAGQEANRIRREAEMERVRIEQATAAEVNAIVDLARTEAAGFERRRAQYHQLRQHNPDILTGIWWDEMSRIFARMKERGRIDLLDNRLGADGLDITLFAPQGRPK